MTLPFPVPDWLPWWAPMAILVPLLIYALVFFVMPFSVFGLRGRLEAIEARIDALHVELRTLVLRLPENPDEIDYTLPPVHRPERSRPPIPPAAPYPGGPYPTRQAAPPDPPYYNPPPPPAPMPEAMPAPLQRVRAPEPQRGWRQSANYGDAPPPPPPPAPRTVRIERPLGGWDEARRRPAAPPPALTPAPRAEPPGEGRVEPRLGRHDQPRDDEYR